MLNNVQSRGCFESLKIFATLLQAHRGITKCCRITWEWKDSDGGCRISPQMFVRCNYLINHAYVTGVVAEVRKGAPSVEVALYFVRGSDNVCGVFHSPAEIRPLPLQCCGQYRIMLVDITYVYIAHTRTVGFPMFAREGDVWVVFMCLKLGIKIIKKFHD